MRQKRQSRILKIISEKSIKTQEQLTEELCREGFATTQATVSRDIKELGLIKTADRSGGYKYSAAAADAHTSEDRMSILAKAMISVTYALHTIVIRTHTGMAQGVAAALDAKIGSEVLGTIAGDDTILIITSGEAAAAEMTSKIKRLFK